MARPILEERMESKHITMTPRHWAIVDQVIKEYDLASVSAGVRFIVHLWHNFIKAKDGDDDGQRESD